MRAVLALRLSSLVALGLIASCAGGRSPPAPPAEEPTPASVSAPASAPPAEPEPFEAILEEARSSTVAVEPAPSVSPPAERSPPPPRGILILGDSMAATDFGQALEEVLSKDPRITTHRRGKSSTGLARPDFFDWMREGPKQVRLHQPDLVIVILGGNDGQDLIPRGSGKRVYWGSEAWATAYAERLGHFTSVLAEGKRRVVFLGLPLMDRPRLEKKLKLIRSVQKRTFDQHPDAAYLDTDSCFRSKDGKLLRTVKVKGWKTPQPLRQEDGIHLTVPGARHFAACVFERLAPVLNPPRTPAS